jgi:hypothetical protein
MDFNKRFEDVVVKFWGQPSDNLYYADFGLDLRKVNRTLFAICLRERYHSVAQWSPDVNNKLDDFMKVLVALPGTDPHKQAGKVDLTIYTDIIAFLDSLQ